MDVVDNLRGEAAAAAAAAAVAAELAEASEQLDLFRSGVGCIKSGSSAMMLL
jgi:hypothetical protein